MATSEDLVPTGLPQGQRQILRAARRRAGLNLAQPDVSGQPQGAVSSPPGSSPQTPSPAGPLGLLLANTPDDFPWLGDTASPVAAQASSPTSVSSALASSAQSSFARAVSARLNQIL